jgi:hypothetical protein
MSIKETLNPLNTIEVPKELFEEILEKFKAIMKRNSCKFSINIVSPHYNYEACYNNFPIIIEIKNLKEILQAEIEDYKINIERLEYREKNNT